MVITIAFISEKFAKFNSEYFDGSLKTPKFEITHVKSYLGQYHWKYDWEGNLYENVIRISDKFDRSEIDVCNTLLHEMIHQYIRQNHIKDTRTHHGRVFYSIADRINRQGGWHISRTDSIEGCGLSDKSNDNKYYMACFLIGDCGKYFRFRINEKYLDYYKRKFELYPAQYKNVFVYVSTDDKQYAHYSKCYRSVYGYYITKSEFDMLRNTEKLIYNTQTLSVHVAA